MNVKHVYVYSIHLCIYIYIIILYVFFSQPSSPDHIKYPVFWELKIDVDPKPMEDMISFRGRGKITVG